MDFFNPRVSIEERMKLGKTVFEILALWALPLLVFIVNWL